MRRNSSVPEIADLVPWVLTSDTVERGDPRWRASRAELRKRTEFSEIRILPHHPNRGRIVADVIVRGMNVGQDMHATGWSKAQCPRL